jgi:2,3-dihydroxyphenylpropionate 1,2-dioxygenase
VGEIVCGAALTHAPGLLAFADAPPIEVRRRVEKAVEEIGSTLRAAQPDVIVALLDDHFDNHFRNLMPSISIGLGETNAGPGRHWLEFLRMDKPRDVAGDPELGRHLLGELIDAGFDLARLGPVEFGNNLMVPYELLRLDPAVPVLPVFINVFTPPCIRPARARAFGQALGRALRSEPGDRRVALLATGGLSHWPPLWFESSPPDDELLTRMHRFQTEGRHVLEEDPGLYSDVGHREAQMAKQASRLVNGPWDRQILAALENDDTDFVDAMSIDEIIRDGGTGGVEVLLWFALMGAMEPSRFRTIAYEETPEWICGSAFALYETTTA